MPIAVCLPTNDGWGYYTQLADNSDATFVSTSSNSWIYDYISFTNPNLGGVINSISVCSRCYGTGAFPTSTRNKQGITLTSDYFGPDNNNQVGVSQFTKTWTTNPKTGNIWQWADLTNIYMILGLVGVSPQNISYSICTKHWLEIDYTLPCSRGAQMIGPTW